MSLFDHITREHAYPLFVVLYTNILLAYLTIKVSQYRKKHNIKYPTVYHKTDVVFNCYQRAHQNTLEVLPIFYSLFVPAAIVYPLLASAFGFAFVTSRFFYAWGYYTGDPAKRSWGSWGELGFLALFIMVLYIALCQLGLMSYV